MKPLLLFTIILLLTAARLQAQNVVRVTAPGSLASQLTQAQRDTCTQLTVQGKLNSADIRVLRQMGGYKEEGCTTGKLQTLNLADAEFVTDKKPYMVLDAKEAMLAVVANYDMTKTRTSSFSLGEPLQNKHTIHYERYRNDNWVDNSNYKWVDGLYINRTELMRVGHSAVTYEPYYYLGRSIEKPFKVIYDQFFFSDNFTDQTWKVFKRMGLHKFNGHRIEKQDNKFLLYSYLQKNHIMDDIFYGCKQLKRVILPSDIRVDDYLIDDQTSYIKYYIPRDKVTIRYYGKNFRRWTVFPPYMLDGVLRKEKQQKLTGSETFNIIRILHNLEPMQLNWKTYRMDTRARFYIEHSDGSEPEDYYLDVDNKRVQKGVDRSQAQFYKASKELLMEMNKLGISTNPVKREKLETW